MNEKRPDNRDSGSEPIVHNFEEKAAEAFRLLAFAWVKEAKEVLTCSAEEAKRLGHNSGVKALASRFDDPASSVYDTA